MSKTLYELIGVSSTASPAEIEAACIKFGERYRPDRNPGDQKAAEMFALFEEALVTLSDPTKRAAYDREIGLQGNDIAHDSPLRDAALDTLPVGQVTNEITLAPKKSDNASNLLKAAGVVVGGVVVVSFLSCMGTLVGTSNAPKHVAANTESSMPIQSYVDDLEIEGCAVSGTIAKCIVRSSGQTISGLSLTGRAQRRDGDRYIELPSVVVSAPDRIGRSRAEITLILPQGTSRVQIDTR